MTGPGNRPEVICRCGKCGNPVPGFPGDYARCRNCRTRMQLPLDPPAGWHTVSDPQKLTALPSYLIITFYAAIVALAWTRGGQGLAGGIVVVFTLAMWILSIMQFAKAAERQRRWWLPAVLYHIAGIAIPLSFLCGLQGCKPILRGEPSLRAAGLSVVAVVGLFLCTLLYGFARGLTARLRIAPDQ